MAKAKKTAKTTKAKTSKSKGIVTYDEELAKMAQDQAAKEDASGGGNAISINYQAATFTFKDEKLDNPLSVIILAAAYENAYYPDAYDPDNIQPPVCFSICEDNDDMVPHETSPEKQHDDCAQCENNQFGSAEIGKGKACKNARRLAVIHAQSIDDVENAEIVTMRLAPTSLKFYAAYVKKLQAVAKRPTFAVFTDLDFVEEKRGNVVMPSYMGNIPDKHISALMARIDEAKDMLLEPYDVSSYGVEEPKKKAPKKKVVKKKAAKKKAGKRKF